MTAVIPARVHILQAREAPTAVIIKRGPSKWFHLVRWNQVDDSLVHGSWFKGRIYEFRSDLSHDGKWMVYLAMGPTKEYWSWTALCQPPWLKATALWPANGTWWGGGFFASRKQLVVNVSDAQPAHGGVAHLDFSCVTFEVGWELEVYYERLHRDGWRTVSEPIDHTEGGYPSGEPLRTVVDQVGVWTKAADNVRLTCQYHGYSFDEVGTKHGYQFHYELDRTEGNTALDLTGATWADWDTAGRLMVIQEGRILRYTKDDMARDTCSFVIDANEWQVPADRRECGSLDDTIR